MSEFPILETGRVILRAFQVTDAPAVFDILSRDEVTRYHNLETMRSIEPAEHLVAVRIGLFPKGIGIRWAATLRERPDLVIGSCGYFNLNEASQMAEIGYDLHPDYWHKGIMREAVRAIIVYGFSDAFFFHLNRIEATTYPEHAASIKLLLSQGFQSEGIRREYGIWKGQTHDLSSFSLLRRDWLVINAIK